MVEGYQLRETYPQPKAFEAKRDAASTFEEGVVPMYSPINRATKAHVVS